MNAAQLEAIADRAITAFEHKEASSIDGAVILVEPDSEGWSRQTWEALAKELGKKGYGVTRPNEDIWLEDGSPILQ